ncbi:P1 family peptidase [Mesorhizobium sp. M1307]
MLRPVEFRCTAEPRDPWHQSRSGTRRTGDPGQHAASGKSSIIAIVATDAPFMPHQLKRLAKRVPLGVALTGGYGYNSSGDIFLAFSTANADAARGAAGKLVSAGYIPDADINPFFDAVIQSVEEAILNALVANEDMTGRDGNFVPALPKAWLEERFGKAARR